MTPTSVPRPAAALPGQRSASDDPTDATAAPTDSGVAPPCLDPADAAVMTMLAGHVPLALLADLAAPSGPASREILDAEGLPDDSWWDPR